MKILGLDLDGVLYNWHVAVYNELIIYEDIQEDFESFWRGGYKTYRNDQYWNNVVEFKHLYTNQNPNKDLLAMVDRLSKQYEFYYITSRPYSVIDATKSWLKKHRFPYQKNLIFTKEKPIVCGLLGVDYMVEDRDYQVEGLLDAGIKVIVVRQLHNEYCLDDLRKRTPVIDNILDLENKLKELECLN